MDNEILQLGVVTNIYEGPSASFERALSLGLHTCQLNNPPDEYIYGERADELTREVKDAIKKTGIKISSVFFLSCEGLVWDLIDGPKTIGLVPEETRAVRIVHACTVSNWAKKLGVDVVTSHIGFIPVDATSLQYKNFIEIMKSFVSFCKSNGQLFAFETGQEPPKVLRRAIEDIGMDNVRVNLDAANILMYGMGNPMEAVEVLGEFVVNTHIKDGKWPTEPGKIGEELALGEGDVHYEEVLPALYKKGFRGHLTIEREIGGEKQLNDIKKAIKILEEIKTNL